MKAFLATLGLAVLLSASPSIANADEGDGTDVTQISANDPGIKSLHDAIDHMRAARTALRTECADMRDAKCRDAFKKVRDEFKVAQKAAIAKHHAFKLEHKTARAEAKAKAAHPAKRATTPRG